MRSLTKKPSSSGGPSRRLRSLAGAHGSGDQQSRQISRIRKQLGNQSMGKSGAASQMRDNLLGFICERLRIMRSIQEKEHEQFKHVRSWFRQVARGTEGFHVPDPTRWHEAARFFKEAAEAMCRGNLSRGAQLLERALGAEKAAYDTVPEQVRAQMEAEEKQPGGYPAELPQALDEGALPSCPLPAALAIADQILSLNDEFHESPPLRARRRRRRDWWEEEGEGEDEEKAAKSGAQPAEERAATTEGEDEEEEEEEEEEEDQQTELAPQERAQAQRRRARAEEPDDGGA